MELIAAQRAELRRLELCGLAPIGSRCDEERLALGMLAESADRLRFACSSSGAAATPSASGTEALIDLVTRGIEELSAGAIRLESICRGRAGSRKTPSAPRELLRTSAT